MVCYSCDFLQEVKILMKYLVFGEVLWDVYPNKKYIGGAPLNFAAHLALRNKENFNSLKNL